MHIVVLDSHTADQGHLPWTGLERFGTVDVYPRTSPEDVASRSKGADAVLTNKVVFDRSVLAELPHLRYLGVTATGTNVVDLAACRERGIAVTNVPGYSTPSVVEYVFAVILHLSRGVGAHDAAVKRGAWAESPDFCFSLFPQVELAGKTLVVVGFGAIGRAVAAVAEAFGMRVVAAAVPGSTSTGRTPLFDALGTGDFVSLHCPLTEATTHLVSKEFLDGMKPGAILINAGRGGLVDEAALVAALRAERLGGVALDVLSREPPPKDDPLLDAAAPFADRLVVTPHVAWATVEARTRLIAESIENFAAYLRGEARNRVEG